MNWIELIGPSGIGKSTLLHSLVSKRENNSLWYTRDEALFELAKLEIDNYKFVKKNIYNIYIKQKFTEYKKVKFATSLFNIKEIFFNSGANYNQYIETFINSQSDISEPHLRMSNICFYKSIIDFLAICDYYNFDKLVILDEAPFNRNPGMTNFSKDYDIILPKAAIYCYTDASQILKRIKKRSLLNNRTVQFHRGLDDKKLLDFILRTQDESMHTKQILNELNVPIIEVDITERIDSKTYFHIREFIHKIL